MRLKTALAEYTAVRAAPAYKAAFAHLNEQAALCFEVRSYEVALRILRWCVHKE